MLKILRKFLATIDEPFQIGGTAAMMKEIAWPNAGSTIEHISKFFVSCAKVEERICDMNDSCIKIKLNEAIFKVIPKIFTKKLSPMVG